MEKIAFTVEEARQVSGVGKNHLYAEINSGALPVVRIGHRVLIPRIELEEWLRRRTEKRAE